MQITLSTTTLAKHRTEPFTSRIATYMILKEQVAMESTSVQVLLIPYALRTQRSPMASGHSCVCRLNVTPSSRIVLSTRCRQSTTATTTDGSEPAAQAHLK